MKIVIVGNLHDSESKQTGYSEPVKNVQDEINTAEQNFSVS